MKGGSSLVSALLALCALATVPARGDEPSSAPIAHLERQSLKHPEGTLSFLYRQGKGIPLVLIPGTFSDSSRWADTIPHLAPDSPLVLIELWGQGESWPPQPETTIEELAQDTLWVLSQLEMEKCYVGGHSLGGMVALEIGRVAPERVHAIISVEGWTNHRAAKDAFDHVMRNTLSAEQLEKRAGERARIEEKWGKDRMNRFAQVWKKWDGTEFLKTTGLPILEIYGDRGKDRPSLDRLHIPERPNITFVWIENASHNLPAEKPGELGSIISEYLNDLEKMGSDVRP